MKYVVSVDFRCKPESVAAVAELLRSALPETRSYPGCQSLDVYFDTTTHTYTALETWDSADHYRAYLQFRTDQGIAAVVDPLLEGGWDGVLANIKWLGEKMAF